MKQYTYRIHPYKQSHTIVADDIADALAIIEKTKHCQRANIIITGTNEVVLEKRERKLRRR